MRSLFLGGAIIATSVLCGLAISSSSADARRHHRHCAPGQFYRVSLGECEGRVRRPSHKRKEVMRHPPGQHKKRPALVQAQEPAEEPTRKAKADRCIIVQAPQEPGVLFSGLPWYSASHSLMTIKPIGEFKWLE